MRRARLSQIASPWGGLSMPGAFGLFPGRDEAEMAGCLLGGWDHFDPYGAVIPGKAGSPMMHASARNFGVPAFAGMTVADGPT